MDTAGIPIQVPVTCCPEHAAQSAAMRPRTWICADCGRAVDHPAHLCDMRLHDLVPGYGDSADGLADAADQARWDRGNR